MKIRATLQWFRPTRSDYTGKYEATLTNLSQQAVKALKAEGVNVRNGKSKEEKNKEDWGYFVVPRSQYPIKVVDSKKNELSLKAQEKIGNGTIVNAIVNPYSHNFGGGGVSIGCTALQIVELIEYDPSQAAVEQFEDEDDGYVYDENDFEEDNDDVVEDDLEEVEEDNDELDDEIPF